MSKRKPASNVIRGWARAKKVSSREWCPGAIESRRAVEELLDAMSLAQAEADGQLSMTLDEAIETLGLALDGMGHVGIVRDSRPPGWFVTYADGTRGFQTDEPPKPTRRN